MKNAVLVLLVFSSLTLFAQEEKTEEKKKKTTTSENEAHDRIVMGFTFDNWIHDIDSLKTDWNSWGFHLYFMNDIPMGKSRLSFAAGLGFSASWVKNNSYLDDSVDSLGTIFRPFSDYKRNSLVASYFDIPLELRFRSKPGSNNKSFKFAIGCVGGVQMSNHTSTKAERNGDTKVIRIHRWDDLTKFRFGPTFRIGYGAVNLFAYYSVTNFFKKDEGPDLHPFSAGFTINGL